MKLGLVTSGSGGILGMAEEARAAEADGFDHYAVPSIYSHDPISICTVAGVHTSRIRLLTGVAPVYPRHPAAMASAALSAGAAAGGRFTLGIGLSHQAVVEGVYGMSFDRPAAYMREYLDVVLPLLDGQAVDHRGDQFTYRGGFRARDRVEVPVLIAAMAPVMLRLAGERTNGTILWMAGARAVSDHVAPRLTRAAENAGRPAPEIVAMLPLALTSDPAGAREAAQEQFANYGRLPSYRSMLDESGADGPGDVAIVGDESALRRQLEELRDAGVTSFSAWLFDAGPGTQERSREFLASLAPEL
ncbi:MAG: TIGR03564 family F420-dependent LLM class oxidoreductase [Dehalococcoidia bacterium]|nr:TIGR03564 family F420-dependent LLM class oxidoreductase [Dehalococcoidia bacterium]MCA9857197.1 TIGR03564 family F420-dependent LLM class oxidoreductase [Dehalococcoidia bacterium]MCB9483821.1 TIGR03564 family F420-dependent LLM class oxidoreductase [Dehalococcoidia bacterium]MCB9491766.1 TIGR03564 family F420-dependent LLM class oxidoreductase [Dehalococcoidia bacterium]